MEYIWTDQVEFEKLKNLRNCTITFKKNLVGILGVNGAGKSTILHALACMYKPTPNRGPEYDYKFSKFFTPNTHCLWNDSKMTLSDRVKECDHDGQLIQEHVRHVVFAKHARWTPKYDRRQMRYVVYIGIESCVPAIEKEKKEGMIRLRSTLLSDNASQRTMDNAKCILNKEYTGYTLDQSPNKQYIGVQQGGMTYCALSMGAGEQRVFAIMEQLIKAPRGALILIDEIDLLLHRDALRKLLEATNRLAVDKNMQVIFTTHNHSILKMDFIQFCHLYQTPEKTLCLENATPDIMYHLTGEQRCPISVYVEDDLAQAIVRQVALELQIKRHVQVETYGAASNCFTCASSIALMRLDRKGTLFVLDGDCYRTPEEKKRQIDKCWSGTEIGIENEKAATLGLICQFILPERVKPEPYYRQCILDLADDALTEEEREYQQVAQEVHISQDSHDYFSTVIQRIGEDRASGLKVMVQMLSRSEKWAEITGHLQTSVA